jgi:uncharacterized membrane protein
MALEVFHRMGTEGLGTGYYEVDRPGESRVNIGRVERWFSMMAGTALAIYGARRQQTVGGAAALAGAAMLYRGATGHCHVYEAIGLNRARPSRGSRPRALRGAGFYSASYKGTGSIADRHSDTRQQLGGERGIHVVESVTINRPIGEVYRFWRNFENLPRFMKHLESVAAREVGISHWVARGPAHTKVEWDARIINEVENQVIGWQSLEGSMVSTAGSVNFDEDPHGTRVTVHLQYNPPGGRVGAAVAWLFGEEPHQAIREDLRRFKRLMESDDPTTAGPPSMKAL